MKHPSKDDIVAAGAGDTYLVAAVDRAVALLHALVRAGPGTLSQVSQEAGCTRTAGFRLLRTLQAHGLVRQDSRRGLWRLGAGSLTLGLAAQAQGALAATACAILSGLSQATGENIYLFTRDGQDAETIAVHRAAQPIGLYAEPGQRHPLHAGPPRLLLAHAPPSLQTRVLAQKLPRFTTATRTDARWIAADLARIRERGYLIDKGEMVLDVTSVSAPVHDPTGQVVAIVSVMSPATRMQLPRPRSLLPPLLDAAGAITRALGGAPPPAPLAADYL